MLKPKVHIICDSRGAGFQRLLSNHTKDLDFSVSVTSGAKLSQLINCATERKEQYDLQIIVGGICDITDKNGPYVTFSERNPRQQLFQAAIQAARKTLGNRIVFSNIASASVSKYNNFKYSSAKKRKKGIHIVEPPITNNQKELESEVRDINILIEDEAEENNLPAIKLDQAITCNSIKRRGRAGRKHSSIKVHSYTRLYDGIHGDEKIKKIWCGKIAKAARAAYNTITLALSQGSSQEEDNWEDFKRRRH